MSGRHPYHMRNGRNIEERHPGATWPTILAYFAMPRRQHFKTYAEAPHYVPEGMLLDERALARAKRLARKHEITLEIGTDHTRVAPELIGKPFDPLRGARDRRHGREILEAVELVIAYRSTTKKSTCPN